MNTGREGIGECHGSYFHGGQEPQVYFWRTATGVVVDIKVDPVFLDTGLGDNQWTRRTGRWQKSRKLTG